MKKYVSLLLVMTLVFMLPMQNIAAAKAIGLAQIEKTMLKEIDSNKSDIIDISRKIWNLKELSSQEFKSSALLEDAFEKHGFSVVRGLTGADPVTGKKCDIPTAFTATYENVKGGPTIGIMVEYDALPNGHSCGHNLISSSGYAAALALKEAFKTTPGKLIVFGTPAEEFGGPGKTHMVAGGCFKGVDVVFETHGSDRWNTESQFMGIVGPKGDILTFKGVASHASASPEKGKSALDAAMLFAMGIEFLREHILDGSRIHYCIMEGGKAPNVVPEETKMNIYVRSMDSGYLKYLQSRIDDIAKGAALMTGTTVEYTWDFPWLAPTPVPTLYDFVKQTAGEVGVSEFKEMTSFGSSDFGCVGYEIPAVNIWFPIAPEGTALHSDAFRDAANSDNGQQQAIIAGKVLALSAYRVATNPKLLSEIKAEFKKNKK